MTRSTKTLCLYGLMAGMLMSAMPMAASAADNAMSGFATRPNAPIEIEADALEVQNQAQKATFSGNVIVTQDDMKLRADRLTVFYDRQSQAAEGADKAGKIGRIEATGAVHISSKDNQSADGAWANYLVKKRQIEMGGKVVLRQEGNVISGSKLLVDLNTGVSRVLGGASAEGLAGGQTGGNGRVRGLFQTPEQ